MSKNEYVGGIIVPENISGRAIPNLLTHRFTFPQQYTDNILSYCKYNFIFEPFFDSLRGVSCR
jgi:hypothetical protein